MANIEMGQFNERMNENPPIEGSKITLMNSNNEPVTGIVGKNGETITINGHTYTSKEGDTIRLVDSNGNSVTGTVGTDGKIIINGKEYTEEEIRNQYRPEIEGQSNGKQSIGGQIKTDTSQSGSQTTSASSTSSVAQTKAIQSSSSSDTYVPINSAKKISYNEDVLNEYTKKVKEYSVAVEERQKQMLRDYKGLTSHGMCTETMSDLSNNFTSVASLGISTANSFAKHGGEMFNLDKSLAQEINDLTVPQDFVENNSIQINTYNVSILSKIDGQSVNEGQKTEKVDEIADSVVAAQDLTNIKDDQTQKQEYDDTTVVGKSILGNIRGDQTQKQDYDSSTSVGNTNLKDITGEQAKEEEYDSSSSIQEQRLSGVKNSQTETSEYDSSSSIQEQGLRGVKNSQTQTSEYDASSVIGQSILGSIKTDSTNEEKKIDEDAITAAVESKKASYEKDEKKVSSDEENKKVE